jgi:hypothetical protein
MSASGRERTLRAHTDEVDHPNRSFVISMQAS